VPSTPLQPQEDAPSEQRMLLLERFQDGFGSNGQDEESEISGCFLVRSWIIIGGQNKGQGSCFIIFQVKRSSAHVFMI